jgi:ATP-dependent DNA ligase
MAQLKLDGDRLQAHVVDAVTVRLFTRNGYDVSDIYSDVCDELSAARLDVPCIFDGELIVVNAAGLPLPWDSAKWRFNSFYARGTSAVVVEEPPPPPANEDEAVVMPDCGEAEANCHNANEENAQQQEEGMMDGLAFVPRKNSRWNTTTNTHRYRSVPVECHLRYVVFDMLMWNGEDLSVTSCRLRHKRMVEVLTAGLLRTRARFVSVIQVRASSAATITTVLLCASVVVIVVV